MWRPAWFGPNANSADPGQRHCWRWTHQCQSCLTAYKSHVMIFFKPCHLFGKFWSTVCGFFAQNVPTRQKISDLEVFHGWKLQFQDLSFITPLWIPVAFPDQNPNSWVSDQTLPSKVQLWRMEAQNSLTLQSSNLKHVNSWRLSKDTYSIFVICFDLVTRMIYMYLKSVFILFYIM